MRNGKPVLIYGRRGHYDYIDIDTLCSQIKEYLTAYYKLNQ